MIAVGVRLYREALAATLSAQEHLRVEAATATSLATLAAVREVRPDVVLVDVSLDEAYHQQRRGAVVRACVFKDNKMAFDVTRDDVAHAKRFEVLP